MNDDLQKFLDELRSRISIADVVGNKVKLTKRGREYLGLCPFHHEKTPSFTVNESKGFYHCFGCGAHGDIVKFEMDANGLPFIEAVKKLSDKVGMQLPTWSKESQEQSLKRKSLYEIMDIACAYFEKCLRMPVGAQGLAYFRDKRALSEETIKKFRLGYAPSGNGLKALLASKGVSERDMAELGLIAMPEDKNRAPHDFFRDRVMIPIMDKQGNVIAFGGRILDNSQPKYLNMDVIALDSFNFNYAVAPLGTALTEEQIIEAWRVCNTPTLCFDGDGAGIKAAIRSIDRVLPILKAGYSVNYIFLKEKKDPDELLHSLGAPVFEQYLQRTKPLVDILWHKCKMNKDTDTPEQKALIEKETFEEVAKIKDEQIRNYYTQEMKKRIYYTFGKGSIYKNAQNNTSVEPPTAEDSTKKTYPPRRKKQETEPVYHFVKKPPLNDLVIRGIIAAMILYPELIDKYEEKLTAFEINDTRMAKVLAEIIEIHQEDENFDSEQLIEKLKLNFAAEIGDLWEINMYKSQKSTLPSLKAEIDNGLLEIQLKQIDSELKECTTLMSGQPENSAEIYARYQQLIKERNNLILARE